MIWTCRRGSTAAEFALTVPVAIAMIFGSVQLGMLLWANAGLQNGIGAVARTATLWPPRSDAEIKAEMVRSTFGVPFSKIPTPTLVRGAAQGQDYVDISLTYETSMNFIIFEVPGITLSYSRRAYIP